MPKKIAMIGAGSVVTKDVAPYSLVVGVPAHLLRKLEKEDGRTE